MVLCVQKVEEVAETVAEAVSSWMTVASRIEIYAHGEAWLPKVAGHADQKAAREEESATTGNIQRRWDKRSMMSAQIREAANLGEKVCRKSKI